MFLVSKLVEFLLLPSNLIGFLAGVGLLAVVLRRPRLSRAALVLATLLLMVGGWSPLGRAALMALEDRFPQPPLTEPITGIVMLGGAVDTHITAERGQATLNEAGERITAVNSAGDFRRRDCCFRAAPIMCSRANRSRSRPWLAIC
jgi:uncharacterized SAM-binding protein YcdF (DUF218 family)